MTCACALLLPATSVAATPIATTGTATGVTTTTATLNGVVDPQGQDTQYQFSYAEQDADGTPDPAAGSAPLTPGSVAAGAGQTPVSVAVSGLNPGTIYHVELSATNASGPAVGADVTFATRPVAPLISSPLSTPSNVTDTSAILVDRIFPYGVPVHYHYEYGPTTSYGTNAPAPDAEADPSANCSVPTVASTPDYHATLTCFDTSILTTVQKLTDLTPGTTYHYRLVASNVAGETTSPDATFMTTGTAPAPPSPSPPAATVQPTARQPRLAILTGSATVSRRRTTILVACGGDAGRCRATLELLATRKLPPHRSRTVVLAHARVSLSTGARERVGLTLDAIGARLLSAAKHGRLRVRATAGGASRTVTLRRGPPASR